MVIATNLGFPRIGARRELKKGLESYWSGKTSEADLVAIAREIRKQNWLRQKGAGIEHIPSNDFSLYDQVLDTISLVGAVPARYGWSGTTVDLATYFAMARGTPAFAKATAGKPAMEMTKWFDTNYHYIVPEFERSQRFRLASTKSLDEFQEAKGEGITPRPVLLGPVSFLKLGKGRNFDPLSLLDQLLLVYTELLQRLEKAGANWIQLDEPCLVLNLEDAARQAIQRAYQLLVKSVPRLKLLVTTYFGGLGDNLPLALNLPVAAVHLDLVRDPGQLGRALEITPATLALSLGLVDGRNIWKTDLERALGFVERAVNKLGSDRVLVGPSSSLLHSPVDLTSETKLDAELRNWLAFGAQKLTEIVTLVMAINSGRASVAQELEANRLALASRRDSPRIHDAAIQARVAAVTPDMLRRRNRYAARRPLQQKRLQLPPFPTTTIGSFPQTEEVRAARAEFKAGKRNAANYDTFLKTKTAEAVRFQEEVGIDLLVHGEFERNDMVEYFGEQLRGFAFTENGWVQSYGSRCVKPPVLFGDVARPQPVTVEWARYAQSLTKQPMKGMLTGPVTILQWSFVRNDQPRSETCRQIALAIRDEVGDLEAVGIKAIQIDEPAIREGLPLKEEEWKEYLAWAVDAFRLAASGVRDETQIHTHMCYSEFNDIMEAVAAMDADVISIETSRSQMELLDAFQRHRYPNDIGPGVYDIHSPRIPKSEEILMLLRKALEVLQPAQLWVNPDCGLKTRRWEEVKPSLLAMVAAAKTLRAQ